MAGRFPAYTDARACKALKDQILKEQRLRLTSADGVRPATLKEQRMSTPLASKPMNRFTTSYNSATATPNAPPPQKFQAPLTFASNRQSGAYALPNGGMLGVYATPAMQPRPFSDFSRPHTTIGSFRPPVRARAKGKDALSPCCPSLWIAHHGRSIPTHSPSSPSQAFILPPRPEPMRDTLRGPWVEPPLVMSHQVREQPI